MATRPVDLALLIMLAGCASYGSVDGVDNLWREVPMEQFEKGVTTQSDVLEKLGPPSQLISLDNEGYCAARRSAPVVGLCDPGATFWLTIAAG